jgi:hypothetical protein
MQQDRQKKLVVRALTWGLAAAMLLISTWRWLGLADSAEPSVEPRQNAAAKPALARVALPEQAGFDDYRAALERPLFHPSRRPFPERKALAALEAAAKAKPTAPPPAPPPPPPPPSPPQGVQLRGTVFAGPVQSAVFERAGNQSYVRVPAGGKLDGWTLVKIDRQEVVLRLGDQSVTWALAKPNDGRTNDGRPNGPPTQRLR